MSSLSNLESAVLKTICWFDVFSYPLTIFEIWQNLYLEKDASISPFEGGKGILYKISDISEILDKSGELKEYIGSKNGYYFLKNNKNDLVKIRLDCYNLAEKKLKKARKIIKIMARFPFVRMIGVCNTLAYRGADEDSDIDLFIVVKENRIWWLRFLCLSFLKIFNLRPKEGDLKDKFCLSFFIDNKHLDLREIKIGAEDIYLNYWLAQLLLIYDEKIYYSFYQANNWLKDYLPFSQEKIINQELKVELGILGIFFKKLSEGFINLFFVRLTEDFLKNIQLKKLPQPLKDKMNQGTGVVVKSGILKFHLHDPRNYFYKQWKEKIDYFGL